jgi:hypothetical protein
MDRRHFIQVSAAAIPVTLLGLASCGQTNRTHQLSDDQEQSFADMKMFGYYQGFGANQTLADRDLSRTDGTGTGTLTAEQANAGEEIAFKFWHGHSSDHMFTITPEHIETLRAGEKVYLLTSVVDGHKHCVRIDPKFE